MTSPLHVKTARYRPFLYAAIAYLLILQAGALLLNVPIALRGGGDFPSFYLGAFMLGSGARHNLYDKQAQVRYEHRFLPHQDAIQLYYHPPYESLPILPLTLLPYRAAFWVWSLAGLAALLLGARLLAPELGNLNEAAGAPVWLVFLCFFPVANTILQGQDSLFLFALLAWAYREFVREREVTAGIALALALFKFQYILPFLFILGLLRWRPRLLVSCGATALALGGLSWWLVGTRGMVAYWQLLRHHNLEHDWRMMNLRGIVLTLGGQPMLVVVLSLLLSLWCGLRKMRRGGVEFSVALVAAALVSYHMHVYDMTILLVPLGFALNQALEARAWKRLLLPALFWVTPLYGLLLHTGLYFLFAFPLLALVYALPRWPGPDVSLAG